MRTLLTLLLLASTAAAQTVTSHLLLPAYGGSQIQSWPGVDVLVCATLPARMGITTATKMAGAVNTNGAAGAICSWAIYPDDDAGTLLANVTSTCTAYGIKTSTVSVSLVQGTFYRFCTCSNKTGQYLGIYELDTSTPFEKNQAMNAATTRIGRATNGCTSGALPSTTGALSTTSTVMPPMMLLEN